MARGRFHVGCLVLCALWGSGCGYRLSGRTSGAGAGQTLSVPVFANLTTDFRIEQRLTAAVRREFIERTRYRLTPTGPADVVLSGEVIAISTIPTNFTPDGRGTAYAVAVDIGVQLRETATGRVLFANPRWLFRETFELSNDSEAFVAEDTAAMDRLARRFSESLVSSIFEATENP